MANLGGGSCPGCADLAGRTADGTIWPTNDEIAYPPGGTLVRLRGGEFLTYL